MFKFEVQKTNELQVNLKVACCLLFLYNSLVKMLVVISQVRKRPLNKKEIAKKEEDIITIQPHSNYLTVHETKLKVRTQ